jgi:hypothetical protein
MTDEEFEIERARIKAEKDLLLASTALLQDQSADHEREIAETQTKIDRIHLRKQSQDYSGFVPEGLRHE